jgi:hypothetical protein
MLLEWRACVNSKTRFYQSRPPASAASHIATMGGDAIGCASIGMAHEAAARSANLMSRGPLRHRVSWSGRRYAEFHED